MTAVMNQYLEATGNPYAGFMDPKLYDIASHTQTYVPYHDITSGTNGSYNAAPEWDAVTGWGSPDLYNLARDWAAASLPATSLSVAIKRLSDGNIRAHGFITPPQAGSNMKVKLFKRKRGVSRLIAKASAPISDTGAYKTTFTPPASGTCEVESIWAGSNDYESSSVSKTFTC